MLALLDYWVLMKCPNDLLSLYYYSLLLCLPGFLKCLDYLTFRMRILMMDLEISGILTLKKKYRLNRLQG